jgi:hypothetical protein
LCADLLFYLEVRYFRTALSKASPGSVSAYLLAVSFYE